jgi:DNA (cytosine-5)-methyltransferase 1
MVYAAGFKAGQSEKARSIGYADEQAPTLSANACGLEPTVFCIQGDGVDRPAIAYDARGNGGECVAPTLTGDHESRVTDYTVLTVDGFFVRQSNSEYADSRVASTQLARQHKDVTDVVVAKSIEDVSAFDCRNLTERLELSATLQAKDGGGYSLNYQNPVFYRALGGTRKLLRYVVRRLIPLECERLQGFPDGWTDIGSWTDTKGKQHKESTDSQRYKALGNSIAIPPWSYVLQKLALCCRAGATMASLFDGIGGFPLIWEWLNGKGSCLWGSEIDEFAIAVTKRHFPEAKERICGA